MTVTSKRRTRLRSIEHYRITVAIGLDMYGAFVLCKQPCTVIVVLSRLARGRTTNAFIEMELQYSSLSMISDF